MFKRGIEVQIGNLDQPTALDLLKRGELAAVVSVAAKPVAVLSTPARDLPAMSKQVAGASREMPRSV